MIWKRQAYRMRTSSRIRPRSWGTNRVRLLRTMRLWRPCASNSNRCSSNSNSNSNSSNSRQCLVDHLDQSQEVLLVCQQRRVSRWIPWQPCNKWWLQQRQSMVILWQAPWTIQWQLPNWQRCLSRWAKITMRLLPSSKYPKQQVRSIRLLESHLRKDLPCNCTRRDSWRSLKNLGSPAPSWCFSTSRGI